jgi:hypothetical protein
MVDRFKEILEESGGFGLFARILSRVGREIQHAIYRFMDNQRCTYQINEAPQGRLNIRFDAATINGLAHDDTREAVVFHYHDHRFDLLGSGWVRNYFGMKCRGVEGHRFDMGRPENADGCGRWLKKRINRSNLAEARRIWTFVDRSYTPIDWQIDFKSGYRWQEKTWFKDIKFGHKIGVDVKVPWELARMQHMPQMALAFQSLEKGSEKATVLRAEFRNQVLDFIANNPPRFGVNWACPMDVGIRAANWLVAYDLLCCGADGFDKEFEAIFARSTYEHGLHIVNNFEKGERRGNHYLANIASLITIAAYLPSTPQTDSWLRLGVEELIAEVKYQFLPDGGNFEGSTAYHRLAAEMVFFSTSTILGLSPKRLEKLEERVPGSSRRNWGQSMSVHVPLRFLSLPEGSISTSQLSLFPSHFFCHLERMAEFVIDITKPCGHIPQIGDNDSGRFFKLGPKYLKMSVKEARERYSNLDGYFDLPDERDYFMEDNLDCTHLVASAAALFDREDLRRWLGEKGKAQRIPEFLCVKALSRGVIIGSQRLAQRQMETSNFFAIGAEDELQRAPLAVQANSNARLRIAEFATKSAKSPESLTLRAYRDFGIYLFTSKTIYLAVRCLDGRARSESGHMHEDQLSVELSVDGRDLVTDPGTYLYSALPADRYRYREATSHFTPLLGRRKGNKSPRNLFKPPKLRPALVRYFGSRGFLAVVTEPEGTVQLMILIEENKVSIYHLSNSADFPPRDITCSPPVSPGYGLQFK